MLPSLSSFSRFARAGRVILFLMLLSGSAFGQSRTAERDSVAFTERPFRIHFGIGMLEGFNAGMTWRIPLDEQGEYGIGPEIAVGLGIKRWNLVLSGALAAQYVSAESGLGAELALRGFMEKWNGYNGTAYETADRQIISLIPAAIARSNRNLFTFSVGPGVGFTRRSVSDPFAFPPKEEEVVETEIVWDIALSFTF